MLYLGTSPYEPGVGLLLDQRRIGLMCQPASNPPRPGWFWAADNGCFADKWSAQIWYDWLERPWPRVGCLFATVPDVVGDAAATRERWGEYRQLVQQLGYPVAFVAQDGLEYLTVPWEQLDCFFIGGTTAWKLSEAAFGLAREARERGKWVHVGRINGNGRYRAWAPFADSCDGTFLAYGPTKNLPLLEGWLDAREREPTLWDGGE